MLVVNCSLYSLRWSPDARQAVRLPGYAWVEVYKRLEHIWLEHIEVHPGEVKPTA